MDRERMARRTLFPIGSDDRDLAQRLRRGNETLDPMRENAVVVRNQEAHFGWFSPSVGEWFGAEHPDQLLELGLERFERLHGQRAPRHHLEIAALAVFIHFLTCAFDGVLLVVQQVLHEHDQLHLATLIDAIAGAVLRWTQKAELAFPIPQHVWLQSGEVTDFADGEELLDWLGLRGRWGHRSCSDRSSRVIISLTAARAACPSNRMRLAISTMGISTS